MRRIKSITEPLEPPRMIAALTFIKPYRDKRKKRQTLLCKLKFVSCDRESVVHSFEHTDIYHGKTYKLRREVLPLTFTEKVEHKNRQNTCAVVIDHCKRSHSIAHKHYDRRQHPAENTLFQLSRFFYKNYREQSDKERPQHILMKRIERHSAVEKVERNLRYYCAYQKSKNVFLHV